MEKYVKISRKSKLNGWIVKGIVGMTALILFRYFRETKRRGKNEEGD